ncbi:MAG: endonuclease [Silicimonas sp.]|nr:endonuclease [Silicimonas sp.]
MIKVDRDPDVTPESLDKPFTSDDLTELQRAEAHFITEASDKSFEFSRYKGADVKRALDELFHGKCAYCESFYAKTQPVDVEHYRPKGAVEGEDDHRGYWWLAMDWENLVPSCIDCNRKRKQRTPEPDVNGTMVELNDQGDFARGKTFKTGKQSAFPLTSDSPRAKWDTTGRDVDIAREERLLLDPTRDDPKEHLVFHVERSAPDALISIVYPKPLAPNDTLRLPVLGDLQDIAEDAGDRAVSAIGAVSIQVYGLNRLSLVQARTKLLRDMEFMLELSIELQSLATEFTDRIEKRETRIAETSGDEQAQLKIDQTLDERVQTRLESLTDRVIRQMDDLTQPEAQFSALAKVWRAAFFNS